MPGVKTNEGATAVGERTGTRSVVKYVRVSASKARQVLDLIRGLEVQRAEEVLRFAERDVAIVIRKALASAVANAEHNDNQAPDELYVSACFADEGPTLKRFRPRARGRAGRIRKRTCHITVIVARMSEHQLEMKRRREQAKPAPTRGGRVRRVASSRRERVARSRQAAAGKATPVSDEVETDDVDTEAVDTDEVALDEDTAAEDVEIGPDDIEVVFDEDEDDGDKAALDDDDGAEAAEADAADSDEVEAAADDADDCEEGKDA